MKFHHLGLATTDPDLEAKSLSLLGYGKEGDPFTDFAQGITGQFLVGDGPRVEVPCAVPGSEVLDPWIARGAKLYHLAFEVPSLEVTSTSLERSGARIVSEPKPALAFANRQVTFLMLPNLLLVELIESAA